MSTIPHCTTSAECSPSVEQALESVLTSVANEAALVSGWQQRQRRLTGASFVQSLVWASLADARVTTEAWARMTGTVDTPVSGPALTQRCTPQAVELFERVLAAAVSAVVKSEPALPPLLGKVAGVYLLDSTTIRLPDTLRQQWPGCGGSGARAALKVQVALDWTSGQLADVQLLSGRTHDARSRAHTTCWPAGAVRVADLAYVSRQVVHTQMPAGVLVVSRLKVGTVVRDAHGQRMEVLTVVRQHPDAVHDLPVRIYGVPCRLIAVRVPPEQVERRRKHLAVRAHQQRRPVSQNQWDWAEWTIAFTTATEQQLSTAEVLVLLRLRWQIELLFKIWKSEGQVDEVRSRKPERILCEILAKLLALVITHWVVLATGWTLPQRSLRKVVQAVKSYAVSLALALRQVGTLAQILACVRQTVQVGCRLNTRSRHPNSSQLALHPDLVFLT
jgi:hypothetical protein